MKNIAFLSLLCLLLFSCRKDSDVTLNTTKNHVPPIIEINVSASVEGIIIDETGSPIENAIVHIDGHTVNTNELGLFVISNITMDQSGTLISAEKDGFFQGSMRFFPKEDSKNFARITLLEEKIIGTIDPATGGEVFGTDGIVLNFPPNSIVDANNDLYTGPVSVAARWLDPEAENLFEIMPGNLQGIDQEDNEVALISFGMMAVELLDDSGNELQLGNGQKATLSFPLSGDYRSKAPVEIPLWHFNEENGLWEEEGKATLQGDFYVGEVTHFSFWNCDAPYPLVHLSGRVLVNTAKGEAVPVANARVKISTSNLGCGYGYTDAEGYFSGKVPAGEILDLVIKNQSAACNSTIYDVSLDPIDSDTDLGNILVNLPTEDIVEISGSLLDCDNEPLTDAWVKIILDGKSSFHYVDANTFNISTYNCSGATELEIIGIDFNSQEESSPVVFNIENQVDAGAIEVCGVVLTNFLRLTLDGQEKLFPSQVQKMTETQFLIGALPGSGGGMALTFYVTSGDILPGDYNQSNVLTFSIEGDFVFGTDDWAAGGCSGLTLDCVDFTEIKLTEYTGVIGETTSGTIKGTFNFSSWVNGQPNTPHFDVPFSCEFSLPLTEF